MTRPTIVTLSSIPSRFHLLEPTLKSLLSQSVKPHEVRVYIPKTYRRFPNWDGTLPVVPAGVRIVRCDMDYGPATKVLPAARELKNQIVDLIFCDDDVVYDRHWHQRLKEASEMHPNACIVEKGDSFPDIADECRSPERLPRGKSRPKDLRYRLQRALYLYRYRPNRTTPGFVDMLAGFAGVLVRPEWFDEAFYEIPDVMWTVDDAWLSGHLERVGVPIWMTGKGLHVVDNGASGIDALTDLVEGAHDRTNADLLVIEYFRTQYGIWKKDGAIDPKAIHRTRSMAEMARRRIKELSPDMLGEES